MKAMAQTATCPESGGAIRDRVDISGDRIVGRRSPCAREKGFM
jgi:hypothetical protein